MLVGDWCYKCCYSCRWCIVKAHTSISWMEGHSDIVDWEELHVIYCDHPDWSPRMDWVHFLFEFCRQHLMIWKWRPLQHSKSYTPNGERSFRSKSGVITAAFLHSSWKLSNNRQLLLTDDHSLLIVFTTRVLLTVVQKGADGERSLCKGMVRIRHSGVLLIRILPRTNISWISVMKSVRTCPTYLEKKNRSCEEALLFLRTPVPSRIYFVLSTRPTTTTDITPSLWMTTRWRAWCPAPVIEQVHRVHHHNQ